MAKMPSMNQLMKIAQDMSKKMEEQMDSVEVEGNAGGGMVKILMNGHKNVLSVEISKEVVDPDDVEMLQDLVTAA
ncbi:MAG TPA: YbaB/EbfC family nucleoid-associated protein, partial [Candidatus Kapabacteria bacterium]|nr:YbaB/EbfC family nucleoid-associated protein [Candidatus Kapabacteria bacterium]